MKWILIASMLAGCATPTADVVTRHQPGTQKVACTPAAVRKLDTRVQTWVEDFYRDATQYGATCYRVKDIQFASQESIQKTMQSPPGLIAGYCTGDGHVVLNEDLWTTRSLLFGKSLLYHELGHCSLGLDHAPEGKVNLMAPYLLSDEQLEENWAELVKKLFTGSMQLSEGNQDVVRNRHFMP